MKQAKDARELALEIDEEQAVRSEAVFDRRWMLLVSGIVVFGLGCAIDALLPRAVRVAQAAPLATQVASAPRPIARPTSVSGGVEGPAPAARPPVRDPRGRRIVTKCIGDGPVTFSDQPCGADARSEHVAVDPQQNLADGLLPSQLDHSAAGRGVEEGKTVSARADPTALRRVQCEALQARIHAIEQGSGEAVASAAQEDLAALRREYRDAQFRMQC